MRSELLRATRAKAADERGGQGEVEETPARGGKARSSHRGSNFRCPATAQPISAILARPCFSNMLAVQPRTACQPQAWKPVFSAACNLPSRGRLMSRLTPCSAYR